MEEARTLCRTFVRGFIAAQIVTLLKRLRCRQS